MRQSSDPLAPPTNADRIARAKRVLAFLRTEYDPRGDNETNLTDLLADLFHYDPAMLTLFDPECEDNIFRMAYLHYQCEQDDESEGEVK